MEGPPLVVAMLNQKGGVGKTTNCYHLAGAFSKLQKQTLLVDLDPQANLTQGFFGPEETESLDPHETVVRLFNDRMPEPTAEDVIRPTAIDRVFIMPGHESLEDYDDTKPESRDIGIQTALRSFIRELDGLFEVILIDCRPTLQLLGWNALLAANRMMTPFQPEDYGSQGVVRVQRKFDAALSSVNPDLRHLGYVLTMVDKRLAVHKAYEHVLRNLYGSQVFDQVVPLKAEFKDATLERKTVQEHKPRGGAAKAMLGLAKEMLERHEQLQQTPPEFLYAGNTTRTNTTVSTELRAG